MHGRTSSVFFSTLAVFSPAFFAASIPAVASPDFAISATSVTMPASGLGATSYTVSAVPMTGTLGVVCQDPSVAAGVRIPTCEYGPLMGASSVTEGQAVTGKFSFYPYGSAIPVGLHPARHAPIALPALAGALLLGFGLRRRARRGLILALLAAGFLAGFESISACGGMTGMISMTPGTYQYTLTANNESSAPPLKQSVTTTVPVTVP